MNKQILLVLLLMQSIAAMQQPMPEPIEQQKREAVQKYQNQRDDLFRGMCFFNSHDSELIKDTYFEKVKEAYQLYKQELCIGCALCTAASAVASCAIPFACDSQFCNDYPAGWLCCCIIKCGAIAADTVIAEKMINDCSNYWKTRKVINCVAVVEQLKMRQDKIVKVE